MEKHKKDLAEKGYTIFKNLLSVEEVDEYKKEFYKWLDIVPELKKLHSMINFSGIFKYHQVGNQRFSWLARTNPKIVNIFKELWETDELVTSFDGCCYYTKEYKGKERYWTHTDQSSRKKGVHCYQSFVSLTNNVERTLQVYEGSNLLHENYFETMNIDDPKDWNIIDIEYIKQISDSKRILNVNEGDLVVWDSRTFHQNLCGNEECKEERLVQYLCYLPKNNDGNTEREQRYRKRYFQTRRTTSHWPYPMNVIPYQPDAYNYYNPEEEIIIDYDSLPEPYIDDLRIKIDELL
tara:strand:+ start:4323 stop:5201 length:879 start_codon:yes stop_codon:yes gene_type:complete